MPALADLLDQFFFADAPGAQARTALQRAWDLASGSTWHSLYLQSLEDAQSEEFPHLSAYAGPQTARPSKQELENMLTADLGEAGASVYALDQNSGTFLTELARVLQAHRLLVIDQQNLFTDEYRQILLNLLDHAHIRFKNTVTGNEPEFSAALASVTGYDAILIASISAFLARAFNITLPTLPPYTQPVTTGAMDAVPPSTNETAPESSPEPTSQPEDLDELIPEAAIPTTLALTDTNENDELPPPEQTRPLPNQLRILLATPDDVLAERAQLTELIQELDAQARARFGLELTLVDPTPSVLATVSSAVELADIFIGVLWLQFGAPELETSAETNSFAGTERDFGMALEQASERNEGWLRAVIYRSVHPPRDLLHLDAIAYARVQQFFERASAYGGEDLVRVFSDIPELLADARARIEAWTYNYAGDIADALSESGKSAAVNGQAANALADFEQAIALYSELDRPESELALWSQVGTIQRNSGAYEKASNAFNASLRLATQLEDDQAAAAALYQIGLLNADTGDWRAAVQSYQQARTHLTPNSPSYRNIVADEINALTRLGDAERDANEHQQASDAYHDALALTQEIDDAPHSIALYQKLGVLAAERGEWQAAIEQNQNAIALVNASTLPETRRALFEAQADAYAHLAAAAHEAGDRDATAQALDGALQANGQSETQGASRVEWLAALGALATKSDFPEYALQAYQRALDQLGTPYDVAQRHSLLEKQANAYQRLGDARFQSQDNEAAENAYHNALAIYQELDRREEQGIVLTQLGAVSAAQGRWQETNAYLADALPRLDAPSAQIVRRRALYAQALALTQIGDAYYDAGEWQPAETAYIHARGNLEQLGDNAQTSAVLIRLGKVAAAQAHWQAALGFYQQARTRLALPDDKATRATILHAEADALRKMGDESFDAGEYAQAQATYRQQLDLAQQLQDGIIEADAYQQLGRVAAAQEQWDEAIDLYDQALAPLPEENDAARQSIQRDQLTAYIKLGDRERAAQQFSQTEMAFRSALTLAQTLNEREQEADLLNTLGLVAIEQEHWDEALVNLRRALGIYNLMPSAPEKPKVIWNIGRAQRGQKRAQLTAAMALAATARAANEWDQAVPELDASLQLARDLGDAHAEGIVLAELGDAASTQKNWEHALNLYNDALVKLTAPDDLERRTQIQFAIVNALRQRSAQRRDAQQWSEADADLSVALGNANELDDSPLQGEIVYESGLVAAGQARWNDAINLYASALERFDETSEQRAAVENAQAEAYLQLGNGERAAQNWQEAKTAYTSALTRQRERGDHAAQAVSLAALGDVAAHQGEWSDAVEYFTQARALTAETAPDRAASIDGELARATLALKHEQQVALEARGDAQRTALDFARAGDFYAQALTLANELQDKSAEAELHAKLGFVATERSENETALEHYRAAAAAYDSPENAVQRVALLELQAQTLQEMGNRAGQDGRWNDALGYYQESIALLDGPAQTEQRNTSVRLAAITLQNIGDNARLEDDWQSSLDAYRRAAGLFGILGDADAQRGVWTRQGEALATLARQARTQDAHPKSLELYHEAAEQFTAAQAIASLEALQRERIGAFLDAGNAFAHARAWNDATGAYQDGFALAQQFEDRTAQAELLYQLGQVQTNQAQHESALAYYQAALALPDDAITEKLRGDIFQAKQLAFHTLGDAQRANGDFARAEENYKHALAAANKRQDRSGAGELYFILGMLAADTHAWDKALDNYSLAFDNLPADAEHRADVAAYQTYAFQEWGDAQRQAGQLDAAAGVYSSALDGADRLGDTERAGEILYRTGLVAAARGDWQGARDAYAQAQRRLPEDSETRVAINKDSAIATRAIQRHQLAAQLEHAQYAHQAQQWDDAATAYRDARRLTRELDDTAARHNVEQALIALFADKGSALRTQESWDQASDAYRESWLLAREYGFPEAAAARQGDLIALASAKTSFYRAADELETARVSAQTKLELAKEFDDLNAQADALYELGMIASEQKQWSDATVYFTQARPLFAQTERTDSLGALDTNAEYARRAEMVVLAVAETAHRRDAGDANAWQQAAQTQFELAQAHGDWHVQADALEQLGQSAAAQEQWNQARNYFARAAEQYEQLEDNTRLVSTQAKLNRADKISAALNDFALGNAAAEQAHWQDALTHYDAARQGYLALGLDARAIDAPEATAFMQLGDVQYGEGQWDEAARAYERGLDLTTEDAERAPLLYRLGRTEAAQEKYVDAIAYYERASVRLTDSQVELRDRVLAQLAFALQQEGKRARAAGEWEQAEAALTRARKMAEASDNFDQVADLWFRLGSLYDAQANRTDALDAYRRAYEFDRKDGNALQQREISKALAYDLLQVGRADLAQNANDQAQAHLHEALSFTTQAESPNLTGDVLEALGDAAGAQGDVEQAIDYYARAGGMFAALEETERWRTVAQKQARHLRDAGAQQLDADEFADAENLYRRAWLLQQAGSDATHDAETHFGLARALLAQERFDDAVVEFDQADALFSEGAPERKQLEALQADALEGSGAQAMREQRWDEAQLAFTRAASARDAANDRARAGLDYHHLAEIAARQNLLDEAVQANEQALARLDAFETAEMRRQVQQQQAQILASVGETEQQAGEWARADDTFRKAMAIAQEQEDLPTLARLYTLAGSLAVAQADWTDAQTEYHHALDVYQELNQPAEQAQVWTRLGEMFSQAKQYDDASTAFQNARALHHELGDPLSEGAMLLRLGDVQGDRTDWDGAIDRYQEALHLFNDKQAHGAKPKVYRAIEHAVRNAKVKEADRAAALGDTQLDAGEWAKAEAAYQDAHALYAEANEPFAGARMHNQLGITLEAQMRWDDSLEHYRAALAGFEQIGIPEAQIGVLANIGDVQQQRKLWNKSEAAYREALAINQQVNDVARAGELLNSLGLVREAQGDWEGASEHYQEAMQQFAQAKLDTAENQAATNLARVRRSARQHAEAECKRALENARAAGDIVQVGELSNTLGLMAADDQKWETALEYYRESVEAFEQVEAQAELDPIWRTAQGTVLNNIGDASQQLGAWKDADNAFSRALGFAREIRDRESEAILLSKLALAAQAQAQLPRALDFNMQALDAYRALGNSASRAELLERVGNLQIELGQPHAAETTFSEALYFARETKDEELVTRLLKQIGMLNEPRNGNGKQDSV